MKSELPREARYQGVLCRRIAPWVDGSGGFEIVGSLRVAMSKKNGKGRPVSAAQQMPGAILLDGLGAHPRVIRVPLLPRGRGSVAPGQREGRRPGLSAQGPPLRKPQNNQPRDPGRPKTHTHVTHTEQEGNRKGAKPSMPRQGSFHSLPHTQIHYTYYYRFESCGGPRSLFLYICLLQLLFSITAGPI